MPRKKLYRSSFLPYHVVNQTTSKAFFKISLPEVFRIFELYINLTALMYGIKTHHFLLMSNHIHWLLSTPNSNLDLAMKFLFSNVAKEINFRSNNTGHLWGGNYKYSVITSQDAYLTVMKYIYRNPCRAEMVQVPELYPYSTLNFFYGLKSCHIKVAKDPLSFDLCYDFDLLEWLKIPFSTEESEQISKSLDRSTFKFRRISRRAHFMPSAPPPLGWPKGS